MNKNTYLHILLSVVLFTVPIISIAQNVSEAKLLQQSDIVYKGSFRVPSSLPGTSYGFDYARTGFTYNPTKNSLFINNHIYEQKTAEISIPQISADLSSLSTATLLQNPYDITEGNLQKVKAGGASSGDTTNMGGLLVYNNKLIGTSYIYYDADGSASLSHFTSGLNLSTTGDFSGMYKVGTLNSGFYAGYMAQIPSEWQGLLGGPVLTGQCCIPIISRTSWGPSAFVFNPDDLGVKNPVPATPLVYYNSDHPTLGTWSGNGGTNLYFNMSTSVAGAVFPVGSRTVLFFGGQGTGVSCYGTGSECNDPVNSDKGTHAYPYKSWVWAYDANDLLAVKNGQKNPWDIRPYAVFPLNPPIDTYEIQGVAYDPATQRVYVSQARAGARVPGAGAYELTPLIEVYELNLTKNSSITFVPAPTPILSPTVNLYASNLSIVLGSPSTLTWSSTNSTTCTASGAWSGTKSSSGSQVVYPTTTSTYVLTCVGEGGTVSYSLTINVSTSSSSVGSVYTFDRNSVNQFNGVASSAISSASNLRLMLRRASVGGNVSDGLNTLQSQNSMYARSKWDFQDRGNPGWQAKVDDFAERVASQQNNFDVFSMKFCYVDPDANWTYYRDKMLQLEAQYPSKKFVWWTLPITTTGDSRFDAFNSQVRSYAKANNKILFDIADIESEGTRNSNGYEIMKSEYSSDGGHLNSVGNLRVAKAFWVMMSSIAGMDGTLIVTPPTPNPNPNPNPTPTGTPVVNLYSSSSLVSSGSPVTLTWTSTNATSCAAGGSWSGNKTTSGSQVVYPATDSKYILICVGSGGPVSQSVTVNSSSSVTPDPVVPPVINPDNSTQLLIESLRRQINELLAQIAVLQSGIAINNTTPIVRPLSLNSAGSDVLTLQNTLIRLGYLGVGNNTGFFGQLTKNAVRKYQCDRNIICSGDEYSTGYGLVGGRTRASLGL